MAEVIVKVGLKKSNIKFTNSVVRRAITVSELVNITNSDINCHNIIIEDIDSKEEEQLKEFINEYTAKDENNKVIFYCSDEDNNATGVADELCYNIYVNCDDVYDYLYSRLGKYVGNNLEKRAESKKKELEEIAKDFTAFGDNNELSEINDSDNEIDNNDITNNNETAEISDISNIEYEEIEEIKNDTDSNESESSELIEEVKDNNEDDTEFKENDSTETEYREESAEDEENSEVKESIEEDRQVDEHNSGNTIKLSVGVKDSKEYIELTEKFNSTVVLYNSAVKDIKIATDRVKELSDLVNVLESEKKEQKEQFDKLINDDVSLINPISENEYISLKEDIEKKSNIINSLNEQITEVNNRVEDLKKTIERRDNTINENEKQIKKVTDKFNNSEVTITKLEDTIKEKEINEDKLSKALQNLSIRLTESDSQVERLSGAGARIDELENNIQYLEQCINSLNDVINILLSDLIESDNKVIELTERVLHIENNGVESSDYVNNITELQSRIKVIEEEKKKITEELGAEKGKSAALEVKLAEKESNSEASKEIDRLNDMCEDLEKSIEVEREKSAELRKMYDKVSSENTDMLKQSSEYNSIKKKLEDTEEQLEKALKDNVINTGDIKISYSGECKIITVFGSGSYGITTTAVSIAEKLSVNSRVTIVDLDLTQPNADALLKINPQCKINACNKAVMNTGMTIAFRLGADYFYDNYSNIVINGGNQNRRTRSLSYISGAYYGVTEKDVIAFDYTKFLNTICLNSDYVIIDLGKLSSYSISNKIIKAMTDISYRNIVVTNNKLNDVRNTLKKIVELKIDKENIVWLLNMSELTSVDEVIKNGLNDIKYATMIIRREMYGRDKTFIEDKVTRDKLNQFLTNIVEV